MAGTGTKQEDQLLSVLLETAAATRLTYVPLRGGGAVAQALAAGDAEMTVNNPIEAVALWREGKLRPLCVFDGKPLQYPDKVAGPMSWADVPTCMSFGIPVQYLMMRGIFMGPGATPPQVAYYNELLDKVAERSRARGTNRLDVVEDFSYPIPVSVIFRVMGAPVADEPKFHSWVMDFMQGADVGPEADTEEGRAAAAKAAASMTELVFGLNRERGTTLVLVTHDLELAKRCQRIIRLKNGAVLGE